MARIADPRIWGRALDQRSLRPPCGGLTEPIPGPRTPTGRGEV